MLWLLEVSWIFLFLSILLVFYHFLHPNRKLKFWAEISMVIVAILATTILVIRTIQEGALPIYNRIDLMLMYSYFLLIIAIVLHLWLKLDMAVAFLLSISLCMYWLYFLGDSESFVYENQYEYLVKQMAVHIFFSIVSYGLFAVSFVFSIIYLVQAKLLKEKKIKKYFFRFKSLEAIEEYAYTSILVGLPFLFLSLMIGMVFMYWHFQRIMWLDSKIVGSLIVFVFYGTYLFFRYRNILRSKKLCYWNIICFLFVLLNFFLFSSLSNFHLWY